MASAPGAFELSEVNTVFNWDPDGPGPQSPVVVVGGNFAVAGAVTASDIACYDPATRTWSGFGIGGTSPFDVGTSDGYVKAFATRSNGELIVVGSFSTMNGVTTRGKARWDGTSWRSLGNVSADSHNCLTIMPNGDLYVGASQTVTRWSGSSWTILGASFNSHVLALANLPNGRIIAGGHFTQPPTYVAQWTGTAWAPIGTGLSGPVYSLTVLPSGNVLAGGTFPLPGDPSVVESVMQWNGAGWLPMSPPGSLRGVTRAAAMLPDGDIIISCTQGTTPTESQSELWRLHDQSWSRVNADIAGAVYAIAPHPHGGVTVGGVFTTIGGVTALHVARVEDDGTCTAFGSGFSGQVRALAKLQNGDLVAGGTFATAGDTAARSLARWDGSSWSELGGGTDGTVAVLRTLPNGDLIIGGSFLNAGDVGVCNIAMWDGTTWASLGEGVPSVVETLAVTADAQVIVPQEILDGTTTHTSLFRWDGISWQTLAPAIAGHVSALLAMPNGDVFAAGNFTTAGVVPVNNIARWNGEAWSPLGNGIVGSPLALGLDANGDLIVGGNLTRAGETALSGIARWDGQSWSALNEGIGGSFGRSVKTILRRASGSIVVGGDFSRAGGRGALAIAEWDGVNWSTFHIGLSGEVQSLAEFDNADIAAGGYFRVAESSASGHFARWGLPPSCLCDPIDFNNDTLFPDTHDIEDFLTVFGGGICPTGDCNDIDFNNDGLFPDTADIDALLSVFSGGPCIP